MDENWAAIIVSFVTGALGLAGIIVTQVLAKHKSKSISPSPAEVAEAAIGTSDATVRAETDTLAYIKYELREAKATHRDNHADVREDLRDIKRLLREGMRDVEDKVDDVKRMLL